MADTDGVDDVDFLIGDWSVVHRRLERRLIGETEWFEFAGPATARKILDGLGNIDEYWIDLPAGAYVGSSLRLFNPATQNWSIDWMDSRDPQLDPPTVGRFQDGRGRFFGDDSFDSKRIPAGFISSGVTRTTCRWEQAFSVDGGASLGDELDHDVHARPIGIE